MAKKTAKFADHVDMLSHVVAAYLDERYKIRRKIEDVRTNTIAGLYALKRGFITSIVEALLLTTGILALILGVILLLNYVLPIEFILVGYGLIVCLFVLLRMKTRP